MAEENASFYLMVLVAMIDNVLHDKEATKIKMTKFKNPENGNIETITRKDFYWCLLFGFLYFVKKKIWFHAVVSFALSMVTYGISVLIYPFFLKSILQKEYLKRGWEIIKE